jgi:hypothetical protein
MAMKKSGGKPPKKTVNTYRKDGGAPLSEYSPKKKSGSGNLIPAGKTHYGNVPLKGSPKQSSPSQGAAGAMKGGKKKGY